MGCRAVLIKGGHGQGTESIDYLVRRERHHRAGRAADRDQKHPRHRLLAVLGHRGGPCQGRGAGNRRAQRQGLDQRRDRGGRPVQCRPRPRTDPSFPSVLLASPLRCRDRAKLALRGAYQTRWQATKCPSLPCFSSGALSRQRGSAIGQRVWKWQPCGGFIGLGTSPLQADPLALHLGVRHRHGGEQRLRVGMLRIAVEIAGVWPVRRCGRDTSPPRGRKYAPPPRDRGRRTDR